MTGKILSFFVFTFSISAFAFAQIDTSDTLTITTYYPSPYGVYGTLKLQPKRRAATCSEGEMTYANNTTPRGLYYCNDTQQWALIGGAGGGGGGYWAEHSYYNGVISAILDNIYSTNNGDVRIGNVTEATDPGATAVPGYGRFLYFSGGPAINTWGGQSDNSDPLWIARYNVASDVTQLRLNIGDNTIGGNDAFVIGREITGGGWVPLMSMNSTGNVGIGTTAPSARLEVNGTVRLTPQAAPPAAPSPGTIYYDSSRDAPRYYDNGNQWNNLISEYGAVVVPAGTSYYNFTFRKGPYSSPPLVIPVGNQRNSYADQSVVVFLNEVTTTRVEFDLDCAELPSRTMQDDCQGNIEVQYIVIPRN